MLDLALLTKKPMSDKTCNGTSMLHATPSLMGERITQSSRYIRVDTPSSTRWVANTLVNFMKTVWPNEIPKGSLVKWNISLPTRNATKMAEQRVAGNVPIRVLKVQGR